MKNDSQITEDNVLSYEDDGTTHYLYAQYSNNWWGWYSTPTLTISTSNSTPVYLYNRKLSMNGYYLRYSNSRISLSMSGSSATLFEETAD